MTTPIELWAEVRARHAVTLLDGGLASELEARGCSLDDPLWSAKVLLEEPEQIAAVHEAYARAGADVLTTATYQASLEGLARRGLGDGEIEALYARAAELARAAARPSGALVAGSAGSYGAFLADGSEYRGDYGVPQADLEAFHRPRAQLIAQTDVDLVAFETIPSVAESEALARVIESLDKPVWVSFSSPGGLHDQSREHLRACASPLVALPLVVGLGVNCISPHIVEPLLESFGSSGKAIIVYPNAGEAWSPTAGWHAQRVPPDAWPAWAARWHDAGANVIGGCCRTTPAHIAALHRWRSRAERGKNDPSR